MNKVSSSFTVPWLCVKTQPKREHIAAAQLERLDGVEIFAPRIRFRRRTSRGRVWFEESLFPCYIFARAEPLMQRTIASSVGVRGFVKFAGECAEVPLAVINTIRNETPEHGPIVIEAGQTLKKGDKAIVAEGAMMGLHAVITEVMPGGDRVKILMELMGTAIPAEVSADTLEKVA
jgi:transcriptional antiterminator RfaH